MTCVTTVRYSVKFNGATLDSFTPSRGLRQGDPLSPFLFLLVADGLSALLRKSVANSTITPVKVCPRAPGVSHLLFEADTLLFFKAESQQAAAIRELINTYAQATGQLTNLEKCSIMFGRSCPAEVQDVIRGTLLLQHPEF
jgi:hypothetical protein